MRGEQALERALRAVDRAVATSGPEGMSRPHRSLAGGSKKRLAQRHEPGEARRQVGGQRREERERRARAAAQATQQVQVHGLSGRRRPTRAQIADLIAAKDALLLPLGTQIQAARSAGRHDQATDLELQRSTLIDEIKALQQLRLSLP